MKPKNKHHANQLRRTATYRLACLLAEQAGVPMPSSANGGHAFDAWLYEQLLTITRRAGRDMLDEFSPETLALLQVMAGREQPAESV